MSLDGYLATKDYDLSWLSVVQAEEGQDYGYEAFNQQVDTYIVGRSTYDVVLQLTGGVFPQAERHDCYVITRSERESKDGVTFYNGNIQSLINSLQSKEGKDIYVDGGAEIVKLLMQEHLIDEYIISIIPIILGDGKRLFKGGVEREDLKLVESKSYPSGLVQVHYKRKTS